MDSILRGLVVYVVLLILFRITGKRSLAQITTFDAVLLLIIAEAVQQALIDTDQSMMNAFLVVITLLGLDVLFSLLAIRSRWIDTLLNDEPLILIEDGHVHPERMRKARVSEDDVLEQARIAHGIERLDQIKYAVLERGGSIAIIPRQVGWAAPRVNPDAAAPAGSD